MTSPGHIFLSLNPTLTQPTSSKSSILHQPSTTQDLQLGLEFLFQTTSIVELKSLVTETKDKIQRNREILKSGVRDYHQDFLGVATLLEELGSIQYQLSPTVTSPESVLSQLDSNCDRIVHQEINDNPVGGSDDPFIYSVASRIKLLVDAPEQIWSGLESSDFLLASQLSCLADRLYTSLMEATFPYTGLSVLTVFPMIKTQGDILRNARSSVGLRASQMLQSITNQELFDTLLAIFLVDKPTGLELIHKLLQERTKKITSYLHKLPNQLESKCHHLYQALIKTIQDIYTCFIINGSLFFDTESYQALGDEFITSSLPSTILSHPFHSNGMDFIPLLLSNFIHGNLLLGWIDSGLFTDLFTWSPQPLSLSGFNQLIDEWFTSLIQQLMKLLQPTQSQLLPHQIKQLRHYVINQRQTTATKSTTTKFDKLLTNPGELMWSELWQPFINATTLHTIESHLILNASYQNQLLDSINVNDPPNLLWDSSSLFNSTNLPHHLQSKLSGPIPPPLTFILNNHRDLWSTYQILMEDNLGEGHQITQTLQSSCFNMVNTGLDTIEKGLKTSQHYNQTLQWIRCLEGIRPMLCDWIQPHHPIHCYEPLSHQHHETISNFHHRMQRLISVGYQPWINSISTEFITKVTSSWLLPIRNLDGKSNSPLLPTHLSYPLMVGLHDVNTRVLHSLGYVTHPEYVDQLLLTIWVNLKPKLDSILSEGGMLNEGNFQFMLDYHFLFLLCNKKLPDYEEPQTYATTKLVKDTVMDAINTTIRQLRCQLKYILGGIMSVAGEDSESALTSSSGINWDTSPLILVTPPCPHLKSLKF